MAKRRKGKDEEEEFDFKLPKFDEEQFLKRERRNIKTTFISFLFGFIIAIISFGFWTLLSGNFFKWELILLLCVFNASWLRYIFIKLNIDITDLGRKGWFTSYAIYFFTWLIVLLVLVNPPFYDDEPPRVELKVLPDMQELGGTVKIIASITDNSGIENIDFLLVDPNGISYNPDDFIFEDNIFIYSFENVDGAIGEFNFEIIARDNNGLESKRNDGKGVFEYSNNTIKLPEPPGADVYPGPFLTYASTIKFDVSPEVNRVYYTVDNGREINATKNGDFYVTNPSYEGWPRNKNVTVKVYADLIHYFDRITDQQERDYSKFIDYNNTIIDSREYYFRVGEEGIGFEDSPKIKLPKPKFVQVPGFELLIFIISLVIAILIFKYGKKDRSH